MIECVASTRARISSKSTFTASMAAVKSSMSRSQASTMRRTWLISPLLLFSKFLSDRLNAGDRRRRVEALHARRATVHVGELLVEVALHVRQLCRDLRLEILQPRRDLLQDLGVGLRSGRAELA